MTDISIKPIESDEEYWGKLKYLKNLKILDSMFKLGKKITKDDLNDAFIAEGMPKGEYLNTHKEIIRHLEKLGLITVDSKTEIITMSKSFPYYLSQLQKIIKSYQTKMQKQTELLKRLEEKERKTPFTEEQKKELEKTLGDKL
jgi:hypothetical protein